jgi:hypothetical protein
MFYLNAKVLANYGLKYAKGPTELMGTRGDLGISAE